MNGPCSPPPIIGECGPAFHAGPFVFADETWSRAEGLHSDEKRFEFITELGGWLVYLVRCALDNSIFEAKAFLYLRERTCTRLAAAYAFWRVFRQIPVFHVFEVL